MKKMIRRTARLIQVLLIVALAAAPGAAQVIPGLEVLLQEQKDLIAGKRVGLITNHTAFDRQMRHASDLLARASGVTLTALFAPEHGIRGAVPAGGKISDAKDEQTGVPVYSIYGEIVRPTPEMLKNVDILVYDIQDVGVRFYTYISTMGEGMAAAADKGIPFVVLDRPDPLADSTLEGRILDVARFRSFVGYYPIPIRYGWTLGELAGFVKSGMKKDLRLVVVKMKNYRHALWYDQTGLPWISPSPNIPTLASTIVYPGLCLFEGTNLSEGRGTMQPFETIGAPWLDGFKLAEAMSALKLEGVLFRPAFFTPNASKYQGQACQGAQLHVTDRNRFRSVTVALHMLSWIRRNYASQFQWRENHIDRLAGSDDVRKAIDQGMPVDQIIGSWQPDLKKFEETRRKFLLYP
jgi:uncharacterized protein YbbC (DUF1343 family)